MRARLLILLVAAGMGMGNLAMGQELREGEIKVSGTIDQVVPQGLFFVMRVTKVELPGQAPVMLDPPRLKHIALPIRAGAQLYGSRGLKVDPWDIKVGGAAVAVGHDYGPGKQLPAREVFVWESLRQEHLRRDRRVNEQGSLADRIRRELASIRENTAGFVDPPKAEDGVVGDGTTEYYFNNGTDRTMNLWINGPSARRVAVPAGKDVTIQLKPGIYQIGGTEADFAPFYFHDITLKAGCRYSTSVEKFPA